MSDLNPKIIPFHLKRSALWRKRQESGYLVSYQQGKSETWVPISYHPCLSKAQEFVRDLSNSKNQKGGLKRMRIEELPHFRRW